MCIKQLPARATMGFLHNLYVIVLSGSVSTHRLCGATKTVPRTKLVGPPPKLSRVDSTISLPASHVDNA
jgi:hypothetical protein